MRSTCRRGAARRDLIVLALAFTAFLAVTLMFERTEERIVPRESASSLNSQGPGARAAFRLLSSVGFSTDRLDRPWTALENDTAALIVIGPIDGDRQIDLSEAKAAKTWVERGGSLIEFRTVLRPVFSDQDPLTPDCLVVSGNPSVPLAFAADQKSPYLRDVRTVTLRSPVRLEVRSSANYHVLLRDEVGVVAVEKSLGRGRVVIIADPAICHNDAIAQADNAQFLVNLAVAARQIRSGAILFDEYHHDVGLEANTASSDKGLFASMPLPLRLGFWHILALAGLIVYVGNRRFGPPRFVEPPTYLASTDYIGSMARLLRRARAADVAVAALYHSFIRRLRFQISAPPDKPTIDLVAPASARFSWDESELTRVITRCEAVAAGQRLRENEALILSRQLENYLRSMNLVGL